MSNFFNFKKFILYFFCLYSLFSLAILLQEKNAFEDGTYTNFTLSILTDGDFNLINQIKDPAQNWLATQTGNHPNYEHPAISAYLFPFISYQLFFSDHNLREAHILATIFFLMLGLILLKKLLDHWSIEHSTHAIAIYALSTPFLWFTFAASVNTNIFSLVYSIVIISTFFLNARQNSLQSYFFLGIALSLGIAIRIQQFWLFSLFLYLLTIDNERSLKKVILFASGFIIPFAALLVNLFVRNASFVHPHNVYTLWTKFGEFWDTTLVYALFGPNGYLVLSPIYLVIAFLGCFFLFKNIPLKRIYLFLIVPPLILFLYYSTLWPIMDSLTGRHQLDYFLIYVVILGLGLDYFKNRKIILYQWLCGLSLLCILWNLRTHIAYFYIDNTDWAQWQFFYFVSPHYLEKQILEIPHLLNPLSSVKATIKFIPLMLLLSFVAYWINHLSKQGLIRFGYCFLFWGLFFYLAFTHLNVIMNPRNVADYNQSGMYKHKVITAGNYTTFYDDFIEAHHKALRWHLMRKDCNTVKRLIEIKNKFLQEVSQEIVYDPIQFVQTIQKGQLKISYLEGQNLEELYQQLESTCPSLEKTTPP